MAIDLTGRHVEITDALRSHIEKKLDKLESRYDVINVRVVLSVEKYRQFAEGQVIFEEVLVKDPNHMGALVSMGDVHFRRGEYEKGLAYTQRALRLDTYDPAANYTAGILYRGKGDLLNAKESLGWAARSMTYRSSAYAQIAEIALVEEDHQKALLYCDKALDFNRYNLNALEGGKNETRRCQMYWNFGRRRHGRRYSAVSHSCRV